MKRKPPPERLRGDNQSICIINNDTGRISRMKRYRAFQIVDGKRFSFTTNSAWRAQKNPKPQKTEGKDAE